MRPGRQKPERTPPRAQSFPGGFGLVTGVGRCEPEPPRSRAHRGAHRTLRPQLVSTASCCCAAVRIQLAGSASQVACSRRASEGAHSGVTGSLAEEKVHPCLRWEDVTLLCPRAVGTWAFKRPRKQPLSKQWLHWRNAHPGLTLKKSNCLLQREKATSCHRPCSGKNVSAPAGAVRAT